MNRNGNINNLKNNTNISMHKRFNASVSNIVGTVLILSISVTLVTAVYLIVYQQTLDARNESATSTYILGSIISENEVVLEHLGGESLSPSDTRIEFTIFDTDYSMEGEDIAQNLTDENENGYWNPGEKVVFDPVKFKSLFRLYVSSIVVDTNSNSMVFNGIIQDGERGDKLYVITEEAEILSESSARLNARYGSLGQYDEKQGNFKIRVEDSDYPWEYAAITWVDLDSSGTGNYNIIKENLEIFAEYEFEGIIRYRNSDEDYRYAKGGVLTFKTLDIVRGMWLFNHVRADNIAYDTSWNRNDGYLKPYVGENRPQWTDESIEGEYALSYDGIDDNVTVNDDDTLDLTDDITIETWIKPLGENEDLEVIDEELSDRFGFGKYDFLCYEPDVIFVEGSTNIYAIAFRGNAPYYGYLVTVEIDTDGTINKFAQSFPGNCIIDYYQFTTGSCFTPDIVHVDGYIYAIVYRFGSYIGGLKTIEISPDGTITKSVKFSIQFSSSVEGPKIIYVGDHPGGGKTFAIAYTDKNSEDGYLTTVNISNNGVITFLDYGARIEQDHEMREIDIIKIVESTNIYALVYRGPDEDGWLRTVEIENDGTINVLSSEEIIYRYRYDSGDGRWPDVVHINGDLYAIAYGGKGADDPDIDHIEGELRTVKIYPDGVIEDDYLGIDNRLEFELTDDSYNEPSLINLGWQAANGYCYVAVAYRGPSISGDPPVDYRDDGYLKTMEIDEEGNIDDPVVDTLEFDMWVCYGPKLIEISQDTFCIVYSGQSASGVIKTLTIDSDTGDIPHNYWQEIDNFEFGYINCYDSQIIKISGDIYAVAFQGFQSDGYLLTVEIIENEGSWVVNNPIDFLEFATFYCNHLSSIIPVVGDNNDVYALAYTGYWGNTNITTVRINEYGEIEDNVLCMKRFVEGATPDLIHITGNIYAIAHGYRSVSNPPVPGKGYVRTITIDSSDGKICEVDDSGDTDKFEFTDNGCFDPDIIEIDWDETNGRGNYSIVYGDINYDGWIQTVQIDSTGMNLQAIDSYMFEDNGPPNAAYKFDEPMIAHIEESEDIYAIVYKGDGYDGWIKTVEIENSGTIIKEIIDQGKFEDCASQSHFNKPTICHINRSVYAIAYQGKNYDGTLVTVKIGTNGNIGDEVNYKYEFDSNYGIGPGIIEIYKDMNEKTVAYAIAYREYRENGYLRIIEIDFQEATNVVVSKPDCYEIKIIDTTIEASINSIIIAKDCMISGDWNYIVLTYDGTWIKLYHNGVLAGGPEPFGFPIPTNEKPLIFGDYNCIMDLTAIYSEAKGEDWIHDRYCEFAPSC